MTADQRELVRAARDRAARAALRGRIEAEHDVERITPRMAPAAVAGSATNRNQRWRRRRGECVGCGGDLGERTLGCPNCSARHGMRALYARRRAA